MQTVPHYLSKLYTTLFCGLICYAIIFFSYQLYANKPINIDTDLKDLAPNIAQNTETQSAINTLTRQLEKNAIILLSNQDIDQLELAVEQFEIGLAGISNIEQVGLNENTVDVLVSTLSPYRFNFLNPAQQQLLANNNDQTILDQANINLTQLSSVRLSPIKSDPLGWFSDYLLSRIDSLAGEQTEDGLIYDDQNQQYHRPFFIAIKQGALELKTQHQLQSDLLQLEQQLTTDYPDLTVNRSGIFFFAADAAVAAETDIKRVSLWSSIGIILVLSLAFRSILGLALPSLSILFGIASAFVITHSIYGSLHVLTIVFGASLIGIVVDYSLHYFYYQAHETDSSSTATRLSSTLHKALALSLCTSVIGYSALGFSELISLQKIALFSVIGLISSWLTVVVLAPYLNTEKCQTSKRLIPKLLTALQVLVQVSVGRFVWISVSIILLIALVLTSTDRIQVGDSPRVFFTPSPELLKQEQFVSRLTNDYEPGRYLVFQGNSVQAIYDLIENVVTNSDNLNSSDLLTVQTWLPSPKQQQFNYHQQARLYQDNGIAVRFLRQLGTAPTLSRQLSSDYQQGFKALDPSQLFSALGSAAPPLWLDRRGLDRRDATGNGNIVSFGLIKKGTNTDGLYQLSQRIDGLDYIDTLALSTDALKQQRTSASNVLILSYLLIAFILLLRYRSVRSVSLLMVPIMATITTVIMLTLFGHAITLFHVMALFLVLGLGMDYVIFCAELRDQQQTALQAILLSAITSLMSFGLLSLSNMPVVSAFGLTILIGNSINLIACLVMTGHNKTPYQAS